MKFLLFILFVAVVWMLWRLRAKPPGETPPPAARAPEAMVSCAHCGVYLPQSESLSADGRHYCCEAHRRAGSGEQ